MKPWRKITLSVFATTFLAGVALILSVTFLITDHMDALRHKPAEKELLEKLEAAVQTDASQAAVLTEEYERQRDSTLERRERYGLHAIAIIVSTCLLLLGSRNLILPREKVAPTLRQVRRHRGESMGADRRGRRRWRRRHSKPDPATALAPEVDLAIIDSIVEEEGHSREAVIAILQRIQKHFRFLPDDALKRVCELTDVTPAQISGVSSFYAQFRHSPVGRYVIKVCHGTACHVSGAREITDEVRRGLKIPENSDTDTQRRFTVDEVACVGCCSLAPVMVVEDDTLGCLTPTVASEAVESYWDEHEP